MLVALTRAVSPRIDSCELTHLARAPIDVAVAAQQHFAYERLLTELGCSVRRVEAAPDLPDSVFIEDTAVVLDDIAVITRPGAASRRPETEGVARALMAFRPLSFLEEPATLDGGDVLRVGSTLFVSLSGRTDRAGVRQMEAIAGHHGMTVVPLEVHGALHLKSAVTQVGPSSVLLNPDWVDPSPFAGLDVLNIDPAEPWAANTLLIGDSVVVPAAHRRTADILERRGLRIRSVPADELAKAEGGVTCCSLIFSA
jgi:dimethylargininase